MVVKQFWMSFLVLGCHSNSQDYSNRVVDAKFTKGLAWLLSYFAIDCALRIGQVRRSFMFDYVNHAQSILLYGQAARAISIG